MVCSICNAAQLISLATISRTSSTGLDVDDVVWLANLLAQALLPALTTFVVALLVCRRRLARGQRISFRTVVLSVLLGNIGAFLIWLWGNHSWYLFYVSPKLEFKGPWLPIALFGVLGAPSIVLSLAIAAYYARRAKLPQPVE